MCDGNAKTNRTPSVSRAIDDGATTHTRARERTLRAPTRQYVRHVRHARPRARGREADRDADAKERAIGDDRPRRGGQGEDGIRRARGVDRAEVGPEHAVSDLWWFHRGTFAQGAGASCDRSRWTRRGRRRGGDIEDRVAVKIRGRPRARSGGVRATRRSGVDDDDVHAWWNYSLS